MSLPYREERVLRRVDRALRQSDPDLASMLSIFAQLNAADRMPARERLRPRLALALTVLRWPVAALAFLVVVIAGGGSRAATACYVAVPRYGLRRAGPGPGPAV